MRVEGLARPLGLAVRFFGTPGELVAALAADPPPRAVLVDLGAPGDGGFVVLEGLAARRQSGLAVPPALAFYSHVETATRQRAEATGAARVVPRSAFFGRFERLLAELTAPPAA